MKKPIMYLVMISIIFSLGALCTEYLIAQEEDTQKGPTVTISGKVDFPDYKPGQRIRINVKSQPARGPADIAHVDISVPGTYSLKVPQNIGNVYIAAVVLETEKTIPDRGARYANNPLEVQALDISGVNITIP